MDRKKAQSILKDAVEHEVPPSTIDLLPNVKERLVAGINQQGEKMNSTNPRRMSRVALASLGVLALLAMAFITPQGRALAQSLLQFFRRSESNVLPLPTELVAPTSSEGEPTALPPSPLMSVEYAERVAGFDAYELPVVPDGFEYLGAMAIQGSISIQYDARGGGGALIINESPSGFVQSEWDRAPADAISQVMVGELEAEIVHGTYVVYPSDPNTAQWNPDAPIMRLRWIQDGIYFEMAKFGGVESIAYLDQDVLIALAASMTKEPLPIHDTQEADKLVPFDVSSPLTIPDGMALQATSFDPALQMVSLSYGYSSDNLRILIKQQPVELPETCTLCGLVGASASVQQVQINGVPGEYAEGVWELTDSGPVWRDNPYLKTLRWQRGGMAYELVYMGDELGKDDLVGIAESMK